MTRVDLETPRPTAARTQRPAPRKNRRGAVRLLVIAVMAISVVLIATVGGYLAGRDEQTVYGGQAEVIFEPGDTSVDLQEEMATQEVVVRSRDILTPAADEFDLAVDRLEAALSVEVVSGSRVLRLTVGHPEPDVARGLAEAIARQYVATTTAVAATSITATEDLISRRVDVFTRRLSSVESELARAQAATQPGPVDRLEAEQEYLLDRIGNLQDSLAGLQVTGSNAAKTRILTSAVVLDEPLRPRPLERAAAGALLGILVAATASFVISRLWTVRD